MRRPLAGLLLGTAAALVAPVAVQATDRMDDPVEVAIDGKMTRDLVGRAIKAALIRRGWKPEKEGPGTLEALLEKQDKWWVRIGVRYTAEHATIRYIRSEGLYYDPDTREIGGNYNKWMRLLSRDIGVNIALLASEAPAPMVAEVVPVLPTRELPSEVKPAPAAAPGPAPPITPPAPPVSASASASASAEPVLRPGTTLRIRALAGADIVLLVKAETPVTRKGPVVNPDGTWWYVTAQGQSGWVRDGDLK